MVALGTMSGLPLFFTEIGNIGSALFGAFIFGLIILLFSKIVRSYISLLLIGLMLGSFTSAIVALLTSISDLQSLKTFTMWSLGSLQNIELSQLAYIIPVFILGVLGSLALIKPLNNIILGENQAKLLGINVKRLRIWVIIITAIFTGLVTAYCGPISFVGLAVPNIVRIAMKTQNHFVLILGSLLFGMLFLLLCDLSIQYLEEIIHLPINVLTALIGSPFVVLILLKKLA
jgi:iron complex transport system permease protein